MRRYLIAAAVTWAMTVGGWASAAPTMGHRPTRVPIGTNPHPVIWGGMKAKPAPAKTHPPRHGHGGRRHHPHQRHYRPVPRCFGGYMPYYEYYYGFGPYYFVPYYDFGYYGYPYGALPHYVNPPQPMPSPELPPAADEPDPPKENIRATNARSRELAWKFIGYGDAQFARGDFAEANNRYRKASRSGPKVADAWFRQGFAMTAVGRYDLAMRVVRRGMAIDPKWPTSGFKLEELFGRDDNASKAHIDALVQAAADDPLNADVLFLVGMHLYFDGRKVEADDYFQRAERIAGADADHIWAFLRKPDRLIK